MGGPHYDSTQERRIGRVVRDVIGARELLYDLVRKDLRVRYRYAVMGFLWAILEPLALALVLTFVFTIIFRDKIDATRSGQMHISLIILSGVVFWQFFANALNTAAVSLVNSQNLVEKVRFTREVVPLATLGYPLVNMLIAFVLLLVIQIALGVPPTLYALWVAPLLAIEFALTAGLALLLSALNVRFRDVSYLVSVGLIFGFYASPVFYELRLVTGGGAGLHPWAALLYQANPMAGLLTAFRDALLFGRAPAFAHWAWPALAAALFLVAGVVVFRRSAPTLSDHL